MSLCLAFNLKERCIWSISQFNDCEELLCCFNRSCAELIVMIWIGLTAVPIPLIDLTHREWEKISKLLHFWFAPVLRLFELVFKNQSLVKSFLKAIWLLDAALHSSCGVIRVRGNMRNRNHFPSLDVWRRILNICCVKITFNTRVHASCIIEAGIRTVTADNL